MSINRRYTSIDKEKDYRNTYRLGQSTNVYQYTMCTNTVEAIHNVYQYRGGTARLNATQLISLIADL